MNHNEINNDASKRKTSLCDQFLFIFLCFFRGGFKSQKNMGVWLVDGVSR